MLKQNLKLEKIHCSLIDNINGYKNLKYTVNDKYFNNIKIKLTDFGHFCPDEDIMEDDFGTKYYQAPEIVLMGDCKNKVDIWALGCTLYELLTGKILFDPKKDKYHNEDYNHLKMFIELCGNFNKDNLLSTKFYREFFDKRGNLRDFSLKDKGILQRKNDRKNKKRWSKRRCRYDRRSFVKYDKIIILQKV